MKIIVGDCYYAEHSFYLYLFMVERDENTENAYFHQAIVKMFYYNESLTKLTEKLNFYAIGAYCYFFI